MKKARVKCWWNWHLVCHASGDWNFDTENVGVRWSEVSARTIDDFRHYWLRNSGRKRWCLRVKKQLNDIIKLGCLILIWISLNFLRGVGLFKVIPGNWLTNQLIKLQWNPFIHTTDTEVDSLIQTWKVWISKPVLIVSQYGWWIT